MDHKNSKQPEKKLPAFLLTALDHIDTNYTTVGAQASKS